MRHEFSDYEWSIISPMLPNKPRGVPRVDDRRVLNGIFWVLRSGAPWRDLPKSYGPHATCYNRFVRWRRASIWGRIMAALAAVQDSAVQMIDTSIVRVHQHGSCIGGNKDQHMGRSRGGLTSRVHAVVDANGLPVRLGLTPGEVHDNQLCQVLLAGLRPGAMLLADRGYDADWIRTFVKQQGAWANIQRSKIERTPSASVPFSTVRATSSRGSSTRSSSVAVLPPATRERGAPGRDARNFVGCRAMLPRRPKSHDFAPPIWEERRIR